MSSIQHTLGGIWHCRSGNRSAGAVLAMVDAGFTRVYDLSGGIVAWQADGGEVVTGD